MPQGSLPLGNRRCRGPPWKKQKGRPGLRVAVRETVQAQVQVQVQVRRLRVRVAAAAGVEKQPVEEAEEGGRPPKPVAVGAVEAAGAPAAAEQLSPLQPPSPQQWPPPQPQ